MFDYFVATLGCPRCGAVSPATPITNLQTHIRGGGADGSELPVGTVFKPAYLTTKHLHGAGYALIAQPPAEVPIRLLDVWTCPACETEQWAMTEIAGEEIERIEAGSMSRVIFESANFISDVNAELLAATLMGISWDEFSKRKLLSIDVLRQRLE